MTEYIVYYHAAISSGAHIEAPSAAAAEAAFHARDDFELLQAALATGGAIEVSIVATSEVSDE